MKFSPFLRYNHRYNGAKSTDNQWVLILPKIVMTAEKTECHCKALWCATPSDQFDFLINQTMISVEVPEEYQKADHCITAKRDGDDIILPVFFMSIEWDWKKPTFKTREEADQEIDRYKLEWQDDQ